MAGLFHWYVVTLLGTPEFWAFAALGLATAYFIFRQAIPENPAWKKLKPAFKRFLLIFIPSILLVFGITLLAKNVWYVQRPCTPCSSLGTDFYPIGTDLSGACNPYCDIDSSFPSGHAATIFAAFSSLYFSCRRRLIIPLFIIPVLVSYSRVALGVHTLTDIFSGALIGLLMPILASIIIQKQHKVA